MEKIQQVVAKFQPHEKGWFYYLKGDLIMRSPQNNYKGIDVINSLQLTETQVPQTSLFYPESVINRLVSEARSQLHRDYERAFLDAETIIESQQKEIDFLHSEVQRLAGNSSEGEPMKKTKIGFRVVNQS